MIWCNVQGDDHHTGQETPQRVCPVCLVESLPVKWFVSVFGQSLNLECVFWFCVGGEGVCQKKPEMGHHDHFSIIFVFFSNCAPHIRKNSCTWEGAAFRKSFLNPFKLFTYEDKLNGEGKEDRLKSENDVLQQGFLLTHRAQRMLPILHGFRKQTSKVPVLKKCFFWHFF